MLSSWLATGSQIGYGNNTCVRGSPVPLGLRRRFIRPHAKIGMIGPLSMNGVEELLNMWQTMYVRSQIQDGCRITRLWRLFLLEGLAPFSPSERRLLGSFRKLCGIEGYAHRGSSMALSYSTQPLGMHDWMRMTLHATLYVSVLRTRSWWT